jgi:hypothetical protein
LKKAIYTFFDQGKESKLWNQMVLVSDSQSSERVVIPMQENQLKSQRNLTDIQAILIALDKQYKTHKTRENNSKTCEK